MILTLRDIETAPPDVVPEPQTLQAQRLDRTWRLLVRDLDDEMSNALVADPNHATVEVHRPSLEEIFVACMTSKMTSMEPPRTSTALH